jgi:hypothetical protein
MFRELLAFSPSPTSQRPPEMALHPELSVPVESNGGISPIYFAFCFRHILSRPDIFAVELFLEQPSSFAGLSHRSRTLLKLDFLEHANNPTSEIYNFIWIFGSLILVVEGLDFDSSDELDLLTEVMSHCLHGPGRQSAFSLGLLNSFGQEAKDAISRANEHGTFVHEELSWRSILK